MDLIPATNDDIDLDGRNPKFYLLDESVCSFRRDTRCFFVETHGCASSPQLQNDFAAMHRRVFYTIPCCVMFIETHGRASLHRILIISILSLNDSV